MPIYLAKIVHSKLAQQGLRSTRIILTVVPRTAAIANIRLKIRSDIAELVSRVVQKFYSRALARGGYFYESHSRGMLILRARVWR